MTSLPVPLTGEPWASTAELLLQNLTHAVAGESFLRLLADVLCLLIDEGRVIVGWRRDGKLTGYVVAKLVDGAQAEAQRFDAISLELDLKAPADLPTPSGRVELIPYDDARGLMSGLYLRGTTPPAELWILCQSRTIGGNVFLDNARVHDGFLAAVERFRVLLGIGVARRRELDTQVNGLYAVNSRDLYGRLQLARNLLRSLVSEPSNCLDQAARLGRLILHEVIDATNAGPLIADTRDDLEQLYQRWGADWSAPSAAGDQVLCQLQCFAALVGDWATELGSGRPAIQDAAMHLLPLWVKQYADWRSPARAEETAWIAAVNETRPILGKWMQADAERRHLQPGEPMRDVPSVRNSLSLWLCLQLLASRAMDNELRAVLAYELRESLRFICFGDRREDLGHLRQMVAAHAAQFVKFCEINRFLRIIEKEGGVNHYSAREHLRHVVDVYVTGHYILDLQLVRDGSPDVAVAEALFGSADQQLQGKAAFSLAALFHDVDTLFLQDRSPVGGRLLQALTEDTRKNTPPPELSSACALLDLLISTVTPSATVASIIAELTPNLGEPASARGTTPLYKWLVAQGQAGLSHGSLSAWFLRRLCRQSTPEQTAIVTAAVRATLLHEARTVSIALTTDPIAGLLVLCNEIFVWDATSPVAEPLERWINPTDIVVTWDESKNRLVGKLSLGAAPGWPRFQIALKPELPVRSWALGLRKAQNLGRLIPDPKSHFAPVVDVISSIPESLQGLHRTTRWLLREELLKELGEWTGQAAMQTWLDSLQEGAAAAPLVGPGQEVMSLRYLGEPRPELECINVDLLTAKQDQWERDLRQVGYCAPSPTWVHSPADEPAPAVTDATPRRARTLPAVPTAQPGPSALVVTVLYGPKDKKYNDELMRFLLVLKDSGTIWYEDEIRAGDKRSQDEQQRIQKADLVVVLASQSAIADREFTAKLAAASALRKQLVPVRLRAFDLADTLLAKLELLPLKAPVARLTPPDRDEVWLAVAEELKRRALLHADRDRFPDPADF